MQQAYPAKEFVPPEPRVPALTLGRRMGRFVNELRVLSLEQLIEVSTEAVDAMVQCPAPEPGPEPEPEPKPKLPTPPPLRLSPDQACARPCEELRILSEWVVEETVDAWWSSGQPCFLPGTPMVRRVLHERGFKFVRFEDRGDPVAWTAELHQAVSGAQVAIVPPSVQGSDLYPSEDK